MKKPVLTVFYQFSPARSSIGGIQSLIGSLFKFAPPEFEVRVVGTTAPGEFKLYAWQPLNWQGKTLQFMPILELEEDNRRQRIPTSVRYTNALRNYRELSDFYHFHRIEYALAARRWTGHKTLFVHNDLSAQLDRRVAANATLWQTAPWLYQRLEAMLLPQFQQIFSCNSQSLDRYQQRFPQLVDRLQYFHNAIDPDCYFPLSANAKLQLKQQLAEHWKIPVDRRWLLFAGRLHPQKDPQLLLNAVAALNDPSVHLIIAGDGELLPTLTATAATLKLDDRISFLGAIAASTVVQFQQTCDFVVLTSAYEGLPMVVLEALACGTPVLTTDAGETPRLLNSNSGRVSRDRTVVSVRDLLHASLRDRAQFSAEACVQVARPYSAQIVAKHLYQTLRSVWQTHQTTAVVSNDSSCSQSYRRVL